MYASWGDYMCGRLALAIRRAWRDIDYTYTYIWLEQWGSAYFVADPGLASYGTYLQYMAGHLWRALYGDVGS